MAEERSAKGRVEVVEPGQAELSNARRVAEAKATVPHAHVEAEVELAAAPAQEEVIAALAGALREHPKLNAAYRDGRFELYERINVAVAVETDAGLAYPTIFDADAKDTPAIAGELSELGKHAGEGTITQPQLAGATLSFADLRAHGVARSAPVLRGGQAAFLTLGSSHGALVLSLAVDARIVHPPEAAAFLGSVRGRLGAS